MSSTPGSLTEMEHESQLVYLKKFSQMVQYENGGHRIIPKTDSSLCKNERE